MKTAQIYMKTGDVRAIYMQKNQVTKINTNRKQQMLNIRKCHLKQFLRKHFLEIY